MEMVIKSNNVVIVTEAKNQFDLFKDIGNNLKHGLDFIKKHNALLAQHKIKKKRLVNYCLEISLKTIFMNKENSTTHKPHKCVFPFLAKILLKMHE